MNVQKTVNGYQVFILSGGVLQAEILDDNLIDQFMEEFGNEVPTYTEYNIWKRNLK